ncbi:MAG: preprotein translocase subunit YajC [Rhizobiales bacterium]|nr:preprotein translocase subunit YajC [Hyphomicrobiales bacterium]
MLITPAYAQGAPAAGGGDFLFSLLPFVLIFVIMYFLIIRPQQKRMKDHQEMISNIRRRDEVVTAGGLIGRVYKVGDEELEIDLAENVRVKVVKGTITQVRTKGEPVRDKP